MDSLFDSFKSNYTKDSYRIMSTVSASVKETFFYVQEIGYLDVIKPYNTIRDNLLLGVLVWHDRDAPFLSCD